LNAFAKHRIQSVKTEVLSQMILFGERSFRHALSDYMAHDRPECPHQGKGNVVLRPSAKGAPDLDSPIACREWLGGLLNDCHRKAA
jgi:hypothetical protein